MTNTEPAPNRATRRHPQHVPRAYMGIPEAANYLDLAPRTIRLLIAEGKLAGYRFGRLLKVKVADLDSVMTPIGGGAA